MKYFVSFLLVAAIAAIPALADDNDAQERVQKSGEVLSDIMRAGDNGIPQDLLDKARCVGIVPGMKKAGFIIGAKYGKGTVVCRENNGHWSAPAMIRVEGGNIGFQIGAGETDLVFIVMNRDGMNKLLQDKFTIGANAGVMAGPVGRSASARTDAQLHAEILSYSRSRGVFAGVSLGGSTLRPDRDANRELYGRRLGQREILTGTVTPPPAANALYAELNRYAPASRYESSKR
jgi:SH3 domain-containing YSC84-like protein 1